MPDIEAFSECLDRSLHTLGFSRNHPDLCEDLKQEALTLVLEEESRGKKCPPRSQYQVYAKHRLIDAWRKFHGKKGVRPVSVAFEDMDRLATYQDAPEPETLDEQLDAEMLDLYRRMRKPLNKASVCSRLNASASPWDALSFAVRWG